MNLLTRIQTFISVKTTAAMDSLEDPRQTLEHAYLRQRELLQNIKRGLVDVATARRQLELQTQKLRQRVPVLDEQAKKALAAGREDLARLALQRKQTIVLEITHLEQQAAEVAQEERKLTQVEQRSAMRVDEFRTRRTTMSARYTAAEAQVKINESLSGIAGENNSLGVAIEQAEDKIERMQARATALDALLENGTFITPLGEDALAQDLRDMTIAQAVDADLAALKAQMMPPTEAS